MFTKKIDKSKIQTWFVTGASSGIGKELCTQLLGRGGYNVVAVSRRIPEFKEKNALCLSVDVTDVESVKAAIEKGIKRFGSIDVLANVAGISSYVTFEEESPQKVRRVMETNYFGTFNTCHSLIKYFRERNNGTIINCTSVMGLVPRAFGTAYCSSKHAVEGLTAVLWKETQNFNCRVMAFEPGLYPTNISKNEKNKFESSYDEYKFPFIDIVKTIRKYRNDTCIAMNKLIDVVENEKLPRRLLLGKDCIHRVKYEIKTILHDIKISWPISKEIAIGKNDKRFKTYEKCDYLIVNFWQAANYGACMTAWAMQELLKSLGYDSLSLYQHNFYNMDLFKKSFSKRFGDKFLNVSQSYSYKELTKLSKNVKGVILGSDQVLRVDFISTQLYKFLLNWVDANTKKIAISPSFGIDQTEFEKSNKFTPFVKNYMTKALKSFDYLSCREVSGKDIYKNVFGLEADTIIDPVFLIDKSKYDEIISCSSVNHKNKIVCYILDDKEEYDELYKYLSKREKTECVSINNKNYEVEDWLKSIKDCKLLVTDSFHGVCFALIFNKPFVCIRNRFRGNARFDSLVTLFDLKKNFVCSVKEVINSKCDFGHDASKLIENQVKKNLDTIKNVLANGFSNNPQAAANKIDNQAFLRGLRFLILSKRIKNYLKYLRCKILYAICSKNKKIHYKTKKKHYKQLFIDGEL